MGSEMCIRDRVYNLRNRILESEDVSELFCEMMNDILEEKLALWTDEDEHPEKWELSSFQGWLERTFGISVNIEKEEISSLTQESLAAKLGDEIQKAYNQREIDMGASMLRYIERMVMLQVIDNRWKDHLYDLDHLRKGIGMRAYGHKDPLIEYQKESKNLFDQMLTRVKEEAVEYVFRIRLASPGERRPAPQRKTPSLVSASSSEARGVKPRKIAKIGRNDPCPCGSGKKYKKCCGR